MNAFSDPMDDLVQKNLVIIDFHVDFSKWYAYYPLAIFSQSKISSHSQLSAAVELIERRHWYLNEAIATGGSWQEAVRNLGELRALTGQPLRGWETIAATTSTQPTA